MKLDIPGELFTGNLYGLYKWFLIYIQSMFTFAFQNDIWQAQSWASVEYDGRWKLLHYGMKKVIWKKNCFPMI